MNSYILYTDKKNTYLNSTGSFLIDVLGYAEEDVRSFDSEMIHTILEDNIAEYSVYLLTYKKL